MKRISKIVIPILLLFVTLGFAGCDMFNNTKFFNVNLSMNDAAYGVIIGSGNYEEGSTVKIEAIANEGCNFVSWAEDGVSISTNPIYEFKLQRNRKIVANFQSEIPFALGYFVCTSSTKNDVSQGESTALYQFNLLFRAQGKYLNSTGTEGTYTVDKDQNILKLTMNTLQTEYVLTNLSRTGFTATCVIGQDRYIRTYVYYVKQNQLSLGTYACVYSLTNNDTQEINDTFHFTVVDDWKIKNNTGLITTYEIHGSIILMTESTRYILGKIKYVDDLIEITYYYSDGTVTVRQYSYSAG